MALIQPRLTRPRAPPLLQSLRKRSLLPIWQSYAGSKAVWRGTGDIQKPFYERYHFEGDSTLVMEELADETLSEVKDVTRYELKNGEFSNGRYVATDLDDKSISFALLTKGSNSFRWQSESKDVWKAILASPGSNSNPAKEVVYKMERWPQK